ncbi:response regulator transcription factor [Goodfellowiella coeruleoviolacea]|uniref:Regulatory protein, luxR family n=1 Tax=Goodfellowiella coeruleoviolacea TaxID=334858 RepID=A0AAE3GIQ4_9PSEU|nr:LuxR C-terminal-related transcriptional regulator [Goodfellowiella coeruleoviolacea]MCP2168947.1 regulatory protein, luxR family [Goodfellowiella coeruleoviolacea]
MTWGLSAPRRQVDNGLSTLTERQRAVLRYVARGLADHEIALVLSLSQENVATEVAAILRTLNLRDRVHAVVFAHETGVIKTPLPVPR